MPVVEAMKIQCNVCEAAEASLLCCADEAALCWACDEKVHAANEVAAKHQRVPLSSSSSQIPKCDICQDAAGFFFCLEDRALLCRKCDVAIHTANVYVSAHQRFLLTGVKVGLDSAESCPSSSSVNSQPAGKISETRPYAATKEAAILPLPRDCNGALPMHQNSRGNFVPSKVPHSGGSVAGGIQQWNLDDFLGLAEHNRTYSYISNGSSKADSGKFGDSNCSSMQRNSEEEDDDKCLGQFPENTWAVPETTPPPTASGLYWPKTYCHISEGAVSVPDICSSHENAMLFNHDGSA